MKVSDIKFFSRDIKKTLAKTHAVINNDVYFLMRDILSERNYYTKKFEINFRQACRDVAAVSEIFNAIGIAHYVSIESRIKDITVSTRRCRRAAACRRKILEKNAYVRSRLHRNTVFKDGVANVTESHTLENISIDMAFIETMHTLHKRKELSIRDRLMYKKNAVKALHHACGMDVPATIDIHKAWETLCDKAMESWLYETLQESGYFK